MTLTILPEILIPQLYVAIARQRHCQMLEILFHSYRNRSQTKIISDLAETRPQLYPLLL
jgi:hypothetical protein